MLPYTRTLIPTDANENSENVVRYNEIMGGKDAVRYFLAIDNGITVTDEMTAEEYATKALEIIDRINGKKTNADRLRAMSDEELAQILALLTEHDLCLNPSATSCDDCLLSSFCSGCTEGNELYWLRQPAE